MAEIDPQPSRPEGKQADGAPLVTEQEFRSLAEAMPQIVWATRADGWNIYFNKQWVDYTGMTLEESYGHGWNIPFHPDDQKRAWDAWQRATQENATYAIECRLKRYDGAYRWWLLRGVPIRDGEGKDTQVVRHMHRHRRHQTGRGGISKSEERLKLAVRAGGVGIWEWNIVNDRVAWDSQMYRLYGVSPNKFDGNLDSWRNCIRPDDRSRCDAEIQSALRGETEFDTAFRVLLPDGGTRHIRALAIVQRDANGRPLRMTGTNWDITLEKEALDRLKLSEQKALTTQSLLVEAQRIAPCGKLAMGCRKRFCLVVRRAF